MHTSAIFVLQCLYAVSVIGLSLYGLQALWLTVATLWQKSLPANHEQWSDQLTEREQPEASRNTWPTVTVQLPIYNEQHVIKRLIDACANLDYPRSRLQIQVLDDSDDLTTAIAARIVDGWRQRGVDILLVRRPNRQGFKAGALAHGLTEATGEFIAIFDADFVPPSNFLRYTIPLFFEGQSDTGSVPSGTTGFVQTRWGHLNTDYSPLTRSQALALDGHFVVEQGGRQAAGFALGFNGSAGVWRRACIEDCQVGGWQSDTLCEDLDLSYRAQLVGWRPYYTNDLESPAEIPPQLIAFKRQQFRWAKGSIQTLCKLGPRVLRSDWPLPKRMAALIHLGSYLIHPLLLLLLLTSLPLLLLGVDPGANIAILSMASLGPPLLYAVGQCLLHRGRWWRRWSYLPLLTLLGTGLCFNNTRAVIQGLQKRGGSFLRTPKFRLEGTHDNWHRSIYRLPIDASFIGEFCLLLYALFTVAIAFAQGNRIFGSYLLIYVGGFALMLGVSLWQARPTPSPRPPHPPQRGYPRSLAP